MRQAIDVGQLVREGVALVAATADADLRPAITRAWGPRLSEDEAQLSICLAAAPGTPMAVNAVAGGRLAVRVSRLVSHVSVQLKGTITGVDAPTAERLTDVDAHLDRWVAETGSVGVPESIARSLTGTEHLIDVTMTVEDRFDETPGPGAGSRV